MPQAAGKSTILTGENVQGRNLSRLRSVADIPAILYILRVKEDLRVLVKGVAPLIGLSITYLSKSTSISSREKIDN